MLVIKLRSANTAETRQYKKSLKALLVLIPLLGITYLVVLIGPANGVTSQLFYVLQAFLISTQVISNEKYSLKDIENFTLKTLNSNVSSDFYYEDIHFVCAKVENFLGDKRLYVRP